MSYMNIRELKQIKKLYKKELEDIEDAYQKNEIEEKDYQKKKRRLEVNIKHTNMRIVLRKPPSKEAIDNLFRPMDF